jgi:hypothetical protein
MSRAEVDRLGLEVRPDPSGQMGAGVRLVGPFNVVFAGDRVASVTFTVTGSRTGIRVKDRHLADGVSSQELAKALSACGPPEEHEGGSVISCEGGTTLIKVGAGNPSVVEVQVLASGFLDH